MSRLHTTFVLGYHGCSKTTGEEVLAGRRILKPSNNKYDWLGPGVYFWEADPLRALEWAQDKFEDDPFVIGAVIDLGRCLDLMVREDLQLVRSAYEVLKKVHDMNPDMGALPENRPGGDGDEDNLLRFLDCATITFLHVLIEQVERPAYDTVRGLFPEGDELYPGSGFKEKTHAQIAVRNPDNIKGYFRVSAKKLKK